MLVVSAGLWPCFLGEGKLSIFDSPPSSSFLFGPKAFSLGKALMEIPSSRGAAGGGLRECYMEEPGKAAQVPFHGQSSPGQGPWVSLAQSGQPSGLGPMPWLQILALSAGLAAAGREGSSHWSSPVGAWAWLESVDMASLGLSPGVALSDEEAAAAW